MAVATRAKVRSAFGDLLRQALTQTGSSTKGLARAWAGPGASHEQIETRRSLLQKYLAGSVTPSQPTRDELAALLNRPAGSFDEDAERRAERQEIADALLPLVDVLHRLAVKAKARSEQ